MRLIEMKIRKTKVSIKEKLKEKWFYGSITSSSGTHAPADENGSILFLGLR